MHGAHLVVRRQREHGGDPVLDARQQLRGDVVVREQEHAPLLGDARPLGHHRGSRLVRRHCDRDVHHRVTFVLLLLLPSSGLPRHQRELPRRRAQVGTATCASTAGTLTTSTSSTASSAATAGPSSGTPRWRCGWSCSSTCSPTQSRSTSAPVSRASRACLAYRRPSPGPRSSRSATARPTRSPPSSPSSPREGRPASWGSAACSTAPCLSPRTCSVSSSSASAAGVCHPPRQLLSGRGLPPGTRRRGRGHRLGYLRP